MSETFEITCEVVIQAKPETVFPYLTEETKMKEWFGEVVEAEAQPGGIFHVGSLDGLDCRGEYVEIIPNEKVIFTWGGLHSLKPGETTVEITLKAEGNATRLTLRHYNNPSKSDADGFAEGWTAHAFPRLKAVCVGRKPDGMCFRSGVGCD